MNVAAGALADFLKGTWKRTLAWHGFGGDFACQRVTNSVIKISAVQDALAEPGTTFLRWTFGEGRGEGSFTIQFLPSGTQCVLVSQDGETDGGVYKAPLGLMTVRFAGDHSEATVTYRILDADTLAVCVVQADAEGNSTVQLGNMTRQAGTDHE